MNTELLRTSLERAKKENGGLTSLGLRFYQRLFEKYPAVKPLFNTPPEEQHKKLMASLGAIVASVDKPTQLAPYLHAMGIRHLKYKTENAHYGAVGENLLAVLGEHLSKEGEWNDELQTTWSEAINTVAKIMIDAASNPDAYADELVHAGYGKDGFRDKDPEPWKLN